MEKLDTILSENSVKELIPQKSPFVMIDTMYAYSPNSIISGLTIKADNIFLENGFFNASGMIENIAQTYALHNGYSYFLKKEKAPIGYIGTVKDVSLFKMPECNQQIYTEVNIIQEFINVSLIEGNIKLNGEILMQLTMKTFLAR